MKNLFLSSALSIASLVIAPSVFAGPGENATGNLKIPLMTVIRLLEVVLLLQQNSQQRYIE